MRFRPNDAVLQFLKLHLIIMWRRIPDLAGLAAICAAPPHNLARYIRTVMWRAT
jgi:hypothetical protein